MPGNARFVHPLPTSYSLWPQPMGVLRSLNSVKTVGWAGSPGYLTVPHARESE